MAASKPCDNVAPLGKHSATTVPLEQRRDAPLKRRATTAAATGASPAAATPAAPLQTTAPATPAAPQRTTTPLQAAATPAANATAPLRRQTTTETHGGASVAALFAGGWVAGAAAELLYAHPLGTAIAHARHETGLLLTWRAGAVAGAGAAARADYVGAAKELARREGPLALWRGGLLPVVASSAVGGVAFAAYGVLQARLRALGDRASRACAGALTGCAVAPLVAPLELVAARLQLSPAALPASPVERLAARATLAWHGAPLLSPAAVLRRGGPAAPWAAARAVACREFSFFLPYYAVFHDVEDCALAAGAPRRAAVAVGGAAAGAAGAALAAPAAHLARVRANELEAALRASETPPPPAPARAVVMGLARDRARLARHVRVAALRAVPPNALAFSVYVATMDLVG